MKISKSNETAAFDMEAAKDMGAFVDADEDLCLFIDEGRIICLSGFGLVFEYELRDFETDGCRLPTPGETFTISF